MRDIPREDARFKSVFTEVAQLLRPPTQFLEKVEVIQTVRPGVFLAKSPKRDQVFMVIAPGMEIADGDTWPVALDEIKELAQYVDVSGAKRTVRQFAVRAPIKQHELTADEFVERLKGGETFLIKKSEKTITCVVCHGVGKECKFCGGSGKVEVPLFFLIKW